MGEPAWGNAQAAPPERIGRRRTTRGTETSKYPEERKSTEKGEKHPERGVKQYLKPCAHKQSEHPFMAV